MWKKFVCGRVGNKKRGASEQNRITKERPRAQKGACRRHPHLSLTFLYLFDSDRLGQVAGTVDVAAAEDGDVVREQLHGNHRQDSLEAVDSVRHFDELRGVFLRLQIALLADDYGATLAGCHLLKGVNAFLDF